MSDIPAVFGIFHRNIEGDEALLRLAQRRFEGVGLGAELYPGSVSEALREWEFAPRHTDQHMAHLPRHLDLSVEAHRGEVLAFARALAGRARGLVVHDQPGWRDAMRGVAAGALALSRELRSIHGAPSVFIEYAAGLPLERFFELAEQLAPMHGLGICIDTGHIGVAVTRWRFAELRPELDFWTLASDPERARSALPDLERACSLAVSALHAAADQLASLGRPMHFHLHDAQPLSRLSPYGVRDHLSFLQQVPVPTRVSATGWVPTMLGRSGLERLMAIVFGRLPRELASLTLEIHHTVEQRRLALDGDADLFKHWTDLTHAELMNGWLSVLTENATLLDEACTSAAGPSPTPPDAADSVPRRRGTPRPA